MKNLTLSRPRSYGRGYVFRKKRHGGEYGAFLMRFYVGGTQRTELTHTTERAEATRILNARMGTVAAGIAPVAGVGRVTVADVLRAYVSRLEVELAPPARTARAHRVVLERALGTVRVADLSTTVLEGFVTACRKRGAKGPGARYAERSEER